jgi:hypothetical protein
VATDWWARAVAIGGAAVASLNMVVSYRTYRWVRPKVKIGLWRTGVSVPEQEDKDASHLFVLRLINNGTTPVTVERIELCRYESACGRRRFNMVKVTRFDPKNRWGTVPPVLPALDGTIYRFTVPQSSVTRGDHLRFRVLLSNDRTATSRLVPNKGWLPDEAE